MDRDRGRHAGGVSGVNTGLFDVLHDPAYINVGPVRDGIHVDLGVVLHKLVDEGRVSGTGARAGPEVEVEILVVVDDLHPTPAEHVRRTHDDRVPELACHLSCLLGRRCRPEPRVRDLKLRKKSSEPGAVFREVYGVWRSAEDPRSRLFQLVGQLQGALAAELQDHAFRFLAPYDLEHVFRRQRLEVQTCGGVVVGRDGLRVGVDHDGVVAALLEGVAGVDASVVELYALADAVGPAAEDDDGGVLLAPDLVLLLVGRVVVGRAGGELAGAGVDGLVGRRDTQGPPHAPHHLERGPRRRRDRLVGQSDPLQLAEILDAERLGDRAFRRHDPGYGSDKERVYGGTSEDLRYIHSSPQGVEDGEDAVRARLVEAGMYVLGVHLERCHGLHQAFCKRPPYRHDLPYGVHPGRERRCSAGELLEGEAGYFGHDVVEGGLERGRGRAGYVVRDLIERVTHGQLGRYLRDRKPRRLARQSTRAAYPRVHLDHVVRVALRVDRKLNVGPAGGDPDLAYYA